MAVRSEVSRSVRAYLKAQVQNAIIMTGLYMVGFAIVGVPGWPVTGFICGLLNLIPYFGSLAALGIALLLKWAVTSDWVGLVYVGGLWVLLQAVEGFILSPRAAGRAGVNPFLSIPLTLAAGFAFGPLGILLAVPVTAILFIVIRATRKRELPPPDQRPVRDGTVQR
jgi:predicted PurR-regulated permease PerM